MKFDLIQKFIEQKEQRQREFDELVRREASALEEVQALKAEYEKTLRDSLVARKDSTSELDSLQERIETAEKTFARRHLEREMYSSVVKPEITAQDVVDSFNLDFAPAFKEKHYNPVLDRLLDAKQEFIDAVMEYHAVVADFEQERYSARSELSDHYYYKLHDVEIQTQAATDHYFITSADLSQLARGERPNFNPERRYY
ncbi:hypothetical protein ACFCP7_00350 [Paenibacillus elgii]